MSTSPVVLFNSRGGPLAPGLEVPTASEVFGQPKVLTQTPGQPPEGLVDKFGEPLRSARTVVFPDELENKRFGQSQGDNAQEPQNGSPTPQERYQALLNPFSKVADHLQQFFSEAERSVGPFDQKAVDSLRTTLGNRGEIIGAMLQDGDIPRREHFREVERRTGFISKLDSPVSFAPEKVEREHREVGAASGNRIRYAVNNPSAFSRTMETAVAALQDNSLMLTSYGAEAVLCAVGECIQEARISHRRPFRDAPGMGGVAQQCIKLLRDNDLNHGQRKAVYTVLDQIELKPEQAEQVLQLMKNFRHADPAKPLVNHLPFSDLRDPLACKCLLQLVEQKGKKSEFVREQMKLRNILLEKLEGKAQAVFDNFSRLRLEAESLVFSPNLNTLIHERPKNPGPRVGAEVEFHRKDGGIIWQNVPGWEVSRDRINHYPELRKNFHNLEVGLRWSKDWLGAGRILQDEQRSQLKGEGISTGSTLHLHFDLKSFDDGRIARMFAAVGCCVHKNPKVPVPERQSTYEVRDLKPPVENGRLSFAPVLDCVELARRGAHKDDKHDVDSDKIKLEEVPTIEKIHFGHQCVESSQPEARLAALCALKSPHIMMNVAPDYISESYVAHDRKMSPPLLAGLVQHAAHIRSPRLDADLDCHIRGNAAGQQYLADIGLANDALKLLPSYSLLNINRQSPLALAASSSARPLGMADIKDVLDRSSERQNTTRALALLRLVPDKEEVGMMLGSKELMDRINNEEVADLYVKTLYKFRDQAPVSLAQARLGLSDEICEISTQRTMLHILAEPSNHAVALQLVPEIKKLTTSTYRTVAEDAQLLYRGLAESEVASEVRGNSSADAEEQPASSSREEDVSGQGAQNRRLKALLKRFVNFLNKPLW